MPPGGQSQKRSGIVRPNIAADLADHGLIAAHLHILAGQDKCHPDQRIEPVDCQGQKCQCLHYMVKPLDMMLFMENDILLFLISEITGQIDFRTEQPHHEGRFDIVCNKDVVPQRNDHRQFASQPDIGNDAVDDHRQHACHPDIGGNEYRPLQRIGSQLFLALGQSLIDCIADTRYRQSNSGILCVDDVARHIFDDTGRRARLLSRRIKEIIYGEV